MTRFPCFMQFFHILRAYISETENYVKKFDNFLLTLICDSGNSYNQVTVIVIAISLSCVIRNRISLLSNPLHRSMHGLKEHVDGVHVRFCKRQSRTQFLVFCNCIFIRCRIKSMDPITICKLFRSHAITVVHIVIPESLHVVPPAAQLYATRNGFFQDTYLS